MTRHRAVKAPRTPATNAALAAVLAAVLAVVGIGINQPVAFVLALATALVLLGYAIGRTRT